MLMMLTDDRLKKVQGKKKRDADAAEAKRIADLATQEDESDVATPAPATAAPTVDDSISADLLSSKDADVIF